MKPPQPGICCVTLGRRFARLHSISKLRIRESLRHRRKSPKSAVLLGFGRVTHSEGFGVDSCRLEISESLRHPQARGYDANLARALAAFLRKLKTEN
jgi:hypothetical protein